MRFSISSRLLTAAAFIALMPAASAQLSSYTQDFESLTVAIEGVDDPALSNDGWLVFGQVLNSDGTLFFDYGSVFPAPNKDGNDFRFCGVKDATVSNNGIVPPEKESHAGPAQMMRHLNVANDYSNTTQHLTGCTGSGENTVCPGDPVPADAKIIVSTVFQSQTVGADDANDTWTFSFDATLAV